MSVEPLTIIKAWLCMFGMCMACVALAACATLGLLYIGERWGPLAVLSVLVISFAAVIATDFARNVAAGKF